MSKELEHFKKSYEKFSKHHVGLFSELMKSHTQLFVEHVTGSDDFSESPWNTVDNETLFKYKAILIYGIISKKLLPALFPRVSFDTSHFANNPYEQLIAPGKLNPQQLTEAFDSIKEIIKETLDETTSNRIWTEITLDFLKSFVNFLISIVTFGQSQSFFKSSTHDLKMIQQIQQEFHSIFETLSKEEQLTELDAPYVDFTI